MPESSVLSLATLTSVSHLREAFCKMTPRGGLPFEGCLHESRFSGSRAACERASPVLGQRVTQMRDIQHGTNETDSSFLVTYAHSVGQKDALILSESPALWEADAGLLRGSGGHRFPREDVIVLLNNSEGWQRPGALYSGVIRSCARFL